MFFIQLDTEVITEIRYLFRGCAKSDCRAEEGGGGGKEGGGGGKEGGGGGGHFTLEK